MTVSYEFEGFRLEPSRRRLLRGSESVPLTPKTFDTLLVLIENRDRVLEKEEALRRLWPDVHVEESSLAQNVFALRRALGDSPDGARFIETVPRRGYRFIAPVRESRDGRPEAQEPGEAGAPRARPRALAGWALLAALGAAAVAAAYLAGRRSADQPEPVYQKLTFRRGFVRGARFAPDGASAVYSASWDGQPPRVFVARPAHPEGQVLDIPESDLLAVSAKGELAILLRPPMLTAGIANLGTLARVSIGGGAPKELLGSVVAADWGPDGESLAVVRVVENRTRRLEYPIGRVLYETTPAGCIDSPRVSPDGKHVAFVACKEEAGPAIVVVGASGGATRRLMQSLRWIGALAWAGSEEIWYTVGAGGMLPELRAITLRGRERAIARLPGAMADVAADGRLLLTRGTSVFGIRGQAPGEPEERELTWLEGSFAVDLSQDGRLVLFGEALEGGGVNGRIYLRSTDGAPAVRLAEGFPACLSPDGMWALVKRPGLTDFTLMPTGAGESRELAVPDLHAYRAAWFPDGQRVLWGAETPGRPGRLWVQELSGGAPRPITPERTGAGVVSPDGRWVATIGDDGHYLYPVDGGARRPFAGALPEEWPVQWGHDGRVYVSRNDRLPVPVTRVDPRSGQRELWREIAPPDRGGIVSLQPLVTRDGRTYVYTYNRFLSDLYLVRGVR